MGNRQRRKFTSEFKAKIAIEAIKERQTIEEISKKYELHPNQVSMWKKEFLEKASAVFSKDETQSNDNKNQEELVNRLYSQIGQQKVEIDWLKKKLL